MLPSLVEEVRSPPRFPGSQVKTVKIMRNGLWRRVAPNIPALCPWAARSVPAVTLVIRARSAPG